MPPEPRTSRLIADLVFLALIALSCGDPLIVMYACIVVIDGGCLCEPALFAVLPCQLHLAWHYK